MTEMDRLYAASSDPAEYAKGYLDYLRKVLAAIDGQEIATFANLLIEARERGSRIFFMGNGGSAATASHFATDIALGPRCPEKPFRALSLTDNNGVMTAIANDDGYDQMFLFQLQNQMAAGDVVVAISASGNSPNVVKAIEWANENGGITLALTGFDGGKLRSLARHAVHVPCGKGEYGPAEDAHMILDHIVGTYLIQFVRAERAAAGEQEKMATRS